MHAYHPPVFAIHEAIARFVGYLDQSGFRLTMLVFPENQLHRENHHMPGMYDSMIRMEHMYHDQVILICHGTFDHTVTQDDEHDNDLNHVYNHIPDDNQTKV